MSVVVRMEMPKRCDLCEFWRVCKNVADFGKARYFEEPSELTVGMKGCKIVCQLPEWHGRLVDAKALFEMVYEYYGQDNEDNENWMMGMINEAPTIVPAERNEK